jgi:hypothetical protein
MPSPLLRGKGDRPELTPSSRSAPEENGQLDWEMDDALLNEIIDLTPTRTRAN